MLNCLLVSSSKTVGGFEYFLRIPSGGLPSIAANLDPLICKTQILDLVIRQKSAVKTFTSFIKKNNYDVIGFSCMVFQYHEILKLAKIAKNYNKKIITVLGGYYATVNYKDIPADDLNYFDFVIRGEGESVFNELIKSIYNKSDYTKILSLSYKKDNALIHNENAPLLDLETLKLPDRNARIFKKGFYFMDYPTDVIETSRGCTYSCNFCSISLMYGRTYRSFKIERIIKDIKDAAAWGARAIFFTDDNITLNIKHFENLCRAIIAEKLNYLKFGVQASVKGFYENPHLYSLIKEAGFEFVFLGIESGKDSALEFFKKDMQFHSSDIRQVVKSLKEQKIFVVGGLIYGNPEDNKESMWQTYEFSKKIGLDFAIPFALTPYPGTKLREELLSKNYITNLYDYAKYDTYRMNIKTDYLDSKELFEIFDSIVHKYYMESGAILRIIKRYPLFFSKSFVKFIFLHPDMVFHHLTKGKYLNKNRFNESAA